MNDLRIDPEFSCLVPVLTAEERDALEASIVSHGCREPLVVWKGEGILLDGHNRLAICKANGVEFTTVEYEFADRAAAHNWIIQNALARRNLTPEQARYLRGKRYLAERKDPRDTLKQNAPPGQSDQAAEDTAARIAKATGVGVSKKTVRRDAEYAQSVDKIAASAGPKARDAILSGDVKLTREQVTKVAAAKPRNVREVREAATKRAKSAPPVARREHDYCGQISNLALRVSAAIDAFKKAGVEAADRSRLASLWELRSEIDALDAVLSGRE